MRKIIKNILTAGMLSGTFFIYGNFTTKVPPAEEIPLEIPSAAIAPEDISFDIPYDHIESARIIYKSDERAHTIHRTDELRELDIIVRNSTYDAMWNDGGLAVKMTDPDYTLILSYTDSTTWDDDFIMVWKENSRLKFRGIWYILDEYLAPKLFSMFDELK